MRNLEVGLIYLLIAIEQNVNVNRAIGIAVLALLLTAKFALDSLRLCEHFAGRQRCSIERYGVEKRVVALEAPRFRLDKG